MVLETFKINDRVKKVMRSAIAAAIDYKKVTGRELKITGEIGDLIVAEKLHLKSLRNQHMPGFDALDNKNRKYQIKSCQTENQEGRVSKFSPHHSFNYAIYVALDDNYQIAELWIASCSQLKSLLLRDNKPWINDFKAEAKMWLQIAERDPYFVVKKSMRPRNKKLKITIKTVEGLSDNEIQRAWNRVFDVLLSKTEHKSKKICLCTDLTCAKCLLTNCTDPNCLIHPQSRKESFRAKYKNR